MNPTLIINLLLAQIAVLAFSPSATVRADDEQADPVRAMQSIGNPPWYDKANDRYAPPTVTQEIDNPIRSQGWIDINTNQEKIAQAKSSAANPAGGGGRGGLFDFGGDWLAIVMLALLALVLVTLLSMLAYHSLRNFMPNRFEKNLETDAIQIDPAKVADLPFEIQPTTHDNPLAEAEALMRAGKFSEAAIFLYGYMLLALDRARKLDLQRGKTNRMYLRELRPHPPLQEIVKRTMLAFEDVYFGQHPLDRERFLKLWNQLDAFHRLAILDSDELPNSLPVAEAAPA